MKGGCTPVAAASYAAEHANCVLCIDYWVHRLISLDVQYENSFRSIGSGITPIEGVPTVEFFADHQLYIVMSIVLIIWFGFIFYLFRLDRKISKLENSLRK